MSQVIRIPSDIYSRLEQHAKGFDTPANVIVNLLNHYENETNTSPISSLGRCPKKGRDKTKYYFDHDLYGKGKLVLAVIEKYISNQPNIDIEALMEVFPKKLQGSIGVFNELMFVKDKYADKGLKRHFLKNNEIIKLRDCSIAVCTEWGADNINNFIDHAKLIGFTISPNNA